MLHYLCHGFGTHHFILQFNCDGCLFGILLGLIGGYPPLFQKGEECCTWPSVTDYSLPTNLRLDSDTDMNGHLAQHWRPG